MGLVWNTGIVIPFLWLPWWKLSCCFGKAESGAEKAGWSLEAMCRKGKPDNLCNIALKPPEKQKEKLEMGTIVS